MKITDISQAIRNPDRVNISVDGSYRFSLDVYQVGELGVKVGNDYTQDELADLEAESLYGKLYARTLEYCLMRPHSIKEVRDYLWRKTFSKKVLNAKTGEVRTHDGAKKEHTERVLERLIERGYLNDETFARYWIEHRNITKGISARKLQNELLTKGVERTLIERLLCETERSDEEELIKVIKKKRNKYSDEQKLIQYLLRQGFRYDDIRTQLNQID